MTGEQLLTLLSQVTPDSTDVHQPDSLYLGTPTLPQVNSNLYSNFETDLPQVPGVNPLEWLKWADISGGVGGSLSAAASRFLPGNPMAEKQADYRELIDDNEKQITRTEKAFENLNQSKELKYYRNSVNYYDDLERVTDVALKNLAKEEVLLNKEQKVIEDKIKSRFNKKLKDAIDGIDKSSLQKEKSGYSRALSRLENPDLLDEANRLSIKVNALNQRRKAVLSGDKAALYKEADVINDSPKFGEKGKDRLAPTVDRKRIALSNLQDDLVKATRIEDTAERIDALNKVNSEIDLVKAAQKNKKGMYSDQDRKIIARNLRLENIDEIRNTHQSLESDLITHQKDARGFKEKVRQLNTELEKVVKNSKLRKRGIYGFSGAAIAAILGGLSNYNNQTNEINITKDILDYGPTEKEREFFNNETIF